MPKKKSKANAPQARVINKGGPMRFSGGFVLARGESVVDEEKLNKVIAFPHIQKRITEGVLLIESLKGEQPSLIEAGQEDADPSEENGDKS